MLELELEVRALVISPQWCHMPQITSALLAGGLSSQRAKMTCWNHDWYCLACPHGLTMGCLLSIWEKILISNRDYTVHIVIALDVWFIFTHLAVASSYAVVKYLQYVQLIEIRFRYDIFSFGYIMSFIYPYHLALLHCLSVTMLVLVPIK